MTSLGETGGAESTHIILYGYTTSLTEIKTNVLTERILILSVKDNFIQMACAIFKGNINTKKEINVSKEGKMFTMS